MPAIDNSFPVLSISFVLFLLCSLFQISSDPFLYATLEKLTVAYSAIMFRMRELEFASRSIRISANGIAVIFRHVPRLSFREVIEYASALNTRERDCVLANLADIIIVYSTLPNNYEKILKSVTVLVTCASIWSSIQFPDGKYRLPPTYNCFTYNYFTEINLDLWEK